jgi:hypothetical protein
VPCQTASCLVTLSSKSTVVISPEAEGISRQHEAVIPVVVG